MAGSFQNEIPPARINLKLDVGKGDAKKKIELPLKLMVMGDFTGKKQNVRLQDREKISINKNNFNQIMENMNLEMNYTVDNKLTKEGGSMPVNLKIKNIDSFKPENVAKEIPELSRLLAARNLVKDLKSNIVDNRELRKRIETIIKDPSAVKSLQDQLKTLLPQQAAPEAATPEQPADKKE